MASKCEYLMSWAVQVKEARVIKPIVKKKKKFEKSDSNSFKYQYRQCNYSQ